MTRRLAVVAVLITSLRWVGAQTVSWCVDSQNLKIGIAAVPADRLQEIGLAASHAGSGFRQVYAGEGLKCPWLNGLTIIEPMPNYAFQRHVAMSKKPVDIARLSYLGDSVVLETSISGRVERRVLKGGDILDLGGDLGGALILHVSASGVGPGGGTEVFVKATKSLAPELGIEITRAVEARLGFQPRYVNIRNDVYFVGSGYPLRYPFVEGEMPPVEDEKGTVTMTCLNRNGTINCARTWD
jgi:hypothetical protein